MMSFDDWWESEGRRGNPFNLRRAFDAGLRLGAARVEELEAAEEGAKTAFAHVVEQKHEVEAECMKLRRLLDAAYSDIRRMKTK
jgi:hypothetical protein